MKQRGDDAIQFHKEQPENSYLVDQHVLLLIRKTRLTAVTNLNLSRLSGVMLEGSRFK